MIGTTLNQRFSLEKELGRGGMGAVYRATDQLLGRTVAIKVLREQAGDEVGRKIRLEAQILARLLHDNVVRLYDFGESDGIYYLVMEEVDGSSYLRRWKLLPLAERLRVAAQVAEALDYAHHQGVIHRDVKPANVLLTAADQVKLSDFGLSQIAEHRRDESGTVRGTPHYMSPEQARGRRIDHRSDLYSLGVMIYESAAGSPPFLGEPLAIMTQHVRSVPEPPRARNPAIAPGLEALILRLLAKEPGDRYPSGQHVAQALREEVVRLRGGAGSGGAADQAATVPIVIGAPADVLTVPTDSPTVAAPVTAFTPASTVASSMTSGVGTIPSSASKAAMVTGTATATTLSPGSLRTTPPLVREMLEAVLSEPIALSPDERYLCGHYLAYLLGGARRRGPLLRRKLDPRNADRARLLLGLTAVMIADADAGASGAPSSSYTDSIADPSAATASFAATDAAVARTAELLEMRYEVRPLISPMVVMKYLACRDTPSRRKRLRELRRRILAASPYARRRMTDGNGALNPGLIPQSLDDLRQIAPDRTEMDDQLVARWNRLGEVWRGNPGFREAVLRYATSSAAGHPAGAEIWPEVVYPLIARARWQRRHRPRAEQVRDALLGGLFHVPGAGLRFDRAFRAAVPEPVVAKLDISLDALVDSRELEVDLRASGPPSGRGDVRDPDSAQRRAGTDPGRGISLHDLSAGLSHDHLTDAPSKVKGLVPLASPDPIRFLQGELRDLWQEAAAALQTPGATKAHRNVPIGPYRLAVIPSIRGRSAGQVAIQGMPNKQIELTTPPFRSKGSPSRPVVAAWSYRDNSLALVHLDFRGVERYVLWHATSGRQTNYGNVAELHHDLYHFGLEIPDQLDLVLSKRFRPRDAV